MVNRRVVVTGIGLVSPLVIGTEANWRALCAGQSGLDTITKFDAAPFSTRIAGEVKGFDPLQFIAKKDVKKMDVFIQYAIAAAHFAVEDAALTVTPEIAPRAGVFIASGIGGFTTIFSSVQSTGGCSRMGSGVSTGKTPTTVCAIPLSAIDLFRTAGFPPNRSCHGT